MLKTETDDHQPMRQIVDNIAWPFAAPANHLTAVDLSVGVWPGMPHYPSPYLSGMELNRTAGHDREKRQATEIKIGSHLGTHLDAPLHMVPEAFSVADMPLSQLAGPADLVRLRGRNCSRPISAADLESTVNPEVEKLIIDTGWAEKHWGQGGYWREGPHLTKGAADFLASLPRLGLLGFDAPNVDSAADTVMGRPAPVHYKLLGRGLVLLESLFGLSRLPEAFFLVAAPWRITGGDGCPCRPLAFFPFAPESRL